MDNHDDDFPSNKRWDEAVDRAEEDSRRAVEAKFGPRSAPALRPLSYRLVLDRHNQPLAILESALGNGQEISQDALRRLARGLIQIADEAEKIQAEGMCLPYHSSIEY